MIEDTVFQAEINFLYESAFELTGTARESFIRDNASTPGIADKVIAMFNSNHKILKPPKNLGLVGELGKQIPQTKHPLIGEQVGKFEITDGPLGEGGYGSVFVASRVDDKIQMRVAIKILKDSIVGSEKVKGRFTHEIRILCRLKHEGIVKVHEWGETNSGIPYFAMEYVEGQSITEYADNNHLPILKRLELFCQLCNAVGYAHENGVIHRDLKPANTLVNRRGKLVLFDFGNCKDIKTEESQQSAPVTNADTPVRGTPGYESPEQIFNASISVRSDVFVLGIILYELLLGSDRSRGEAGSSGRNPGVDYKRLSKSWPDQDIQVLLKKRQATHGKLARQLDQRLSGIVAKATADIPSDRFADASELGDAVKHYLKSAQTRSGWAIALSLASCALLIAAIAAVSIWNKPTKNKVASSVPEDSSRTADQVIEGESLESGAGHDQRPYLSLVPGNQEMRESPSLFGATIGSTARGAIDTWITLRNGFRVVGNDRSPITMEGLSIGNERWRNIDAEVTIKPWSKSEVGAGIITYGMRIREQDPSNCILLTFTQSSSPTVGTVFRATIIVGNQPVELERSWLMDFNFLEEHRMRVSIREDMFVVYVDDKQVAPEIPIIDGKPFQGAIGVFFGGTSIDGCDFTDFKVTDPRGDELLTGHPDDFITLDEMYETENKQQDRKYGSFPPFNDRPRRPSIGPKVSGPNEA